jgi:hypothetical protein
VRGKALPPACSPVSTRANTLMRRTSRMCICQHLYTKKEKKIDNEKMCGMKEANQSVLQVKELNGLIHLGRKEKNKKKT